MNAKGKVLISGKRIGYQFNKKSPGQRRSTCLVHHILASGIGTSVPWIRYQGMILEVKKSQSYAYEWEAVRQLPQ